MKLCLFILLALSLSQDASKLPPDFSTLQKVSLEELAIKTRAHDEMWGITKIERWDLNQDIGELVFSLPGGFRAVAPAQIVGTYNSEDQTWMWAWANSSVEEKLSVDALKVREYGIKHKIERLTKPKWKGTEKEAWAMVAVALKLCGKQGAYRGPSGSTYVFMTFGEVVMRKN